jgi:peptidoglycan/LPS O-acetylase OafA/YrhL
VQAFVIKRILRIYPLSVTCVLAVFFMEIPPLPFVDFRPIEPGTLASNLALTMNILGSQLVLSPLWSLPIELQMYMLLPFLYSAVAVHPFGKRAIAAWSIAVVLAMLQPALSERLNVLFFAPCFMAGIVAYTLLGNVRASLHGRLWIPFLLGLVLAYLLVETALPGVHNPAPQWLLCLAVGLGIPLFRGVQSPIIKALGATVAKYSYGVYLFHCIALWFGCYVLADWPWPAQWMTAALLLAALCAICYHGIEKPGIDLGARLARRYEATRRGPATDSTD